MKLNIKFSFLSLLLASTAPGFAIETSHCTVDAATLLMKAGAGVDSGPSRLAKDATPEGSPGPVEPLPGSVEFDQSAAVAHIKKSGAQVNYLGFAHGLHRLSASSNNQFMLFQLSPDGAAVVAGLASDITVDNLKSISGAHLSPLGELHGLAGYYLQNGPEFQVLYETPDHTAMISGVMWEMSGDTTKNVTKDQVAKIEGTTPKVLIGNEQVDVSADSKKSPVALVEKTTFGTYGDPNAPRIYVFIDPLCIYSIRAMQELQPYINKRLVDVAIIPIAVLDYEDQNRSTPAALSLLSMDRSGMVEAWSKQQYDRPSTPESQAHLHDNMAVAAILGLNGTPMVVWKKADGSEGRIDGLPQDWDVVISSLAGGANVARR
jgi:thiol:disulfide interchange protein DsbG